MPISQSRYVKITSGVGGTSNVATRQLIMRLFTDNQLLPPQSHMEFSNANNVGLYFGFSSNEYFRAQFYFGWISKLIQQAPSLSFARWVSIAVGSQIHGAPSVGYSVTTLDMITTGDFTLTMGGFTDHITGINLGAAGSLAAIAAAIQAKINAYTAGGVAWTGATVVYNSTRNSFDLVSGAVGTDTISVVAGTSQDVAGPIGWLTGATLANGSAVEGIAQCLTTSYQQSNNFGSFEFMPATLLTLAQHTQAALWNNSLTPNVQFIYAVHVSPTNAAAWSAALIGIGGTCVTLDAPAGAVNEYHAMVPGMILAATDYTQNNQVQNYMYQQFNLTPSVTNDTDANTYDSLRINYYGCTQNAGQNISFYQRGVMMGLATDPTDINTYANEIWLKEDIAVGILGLQLALPQIAANNGGRAQLTTQVQSSIKQALLNGTISSGKNLTVAQQLYIQTASGSSTAYLQVQSAGYWFTISVQSYVNVLNGLTEYRAVYTLIYSKDDDIRVVNGSDILI